MLDNWANFFIAQVGAAGALTGLIFVGVSINLSKIIAYGNMTGRAFQALILLVAVLVISSLALVPGQSLWLFGAEILLVGIITLAFTLPSQLRALRTVEARFKSRQWFNLVASQLATLPFLVAGILLVAGMDWGLYWIVPGVIFCVAVALMDSWVLLIEINR